MRVHSTYRTVILQIFPTPKQEKILRKAEESVFKFLELSRRELQKLLYHKFKDDSIEPRMLTLLCQPFTGSLGEKAILCFDRRNSKFVCENGIWYVEVKLARGRNAREKILIAKRNCEYYDVIEDCSQFFVIARENDIWFVYVSIPITNETNGKIVGIDFNLRKWVAAPYEGKPLFFDVSKFEREIDYLQRRLSRAYQKEDKEKIEKLNAKICEIVKHAHANFLAAIKENSEFAHLQLKI